MRIPIKCCQGSGQNDSFSFLRPSLRVYYEKTPQQVHTHRRPNGDKVQLDHIITPQAWRGSVLDVTTNHTAALASNHYLIQATIRVKRGALPPTTRPPQLTRQPTLAQKKDFNQQLTNHLTTPTTTPQTQEEIDGQWKSIASTITEVANSTIPTKPKHTKQPWITEATWILITQRDQARTAEHQELEFQLHKQIRKQAKKDKTQWLKDQVAVEVSAKAPPAKEK